MAISIVAPYIGMTLLVIFGIIMWHLADDSDKKEIFLLSHIKTL